MPSGKGIVALVGSGEFLPGADRLDRALLERLGTAPRVAVLPSASAPDGPGVMERWAKMGVAHFERLGATAEAVMVRNRADAASSEPAGRLAAANFIYLSGGKPGFLVEVLRGTACWRAIVEVFRAGGVVAGCSAGAMALAGSLPGFLRPAPGLGLVPGLAVIPHFDEIPGWLNGLGRLAGRPGLTVVGVEGSTGLVGCGPEWWVAGTGGVTVYGGPGRETRRYRPGESVPLGL